MKKNLPTLFSALSLVLSSSLIAAHLTRPVDLTSLADTSAAHIGSWLYTSFPARPELLLPLVFVVSLLSIAAIAAFHLKADARLQQTRELNTRTVKIRSRETRRRHTPVTSRLLISRAIQ